MNLLPRSIARFARRGVFNTDSADFGHGFYTDFRSSLLDLLVGYLNTDFTDFGHGFYTDFRSPLLALLVGNLNTDFTDLGHGF